MRSGLVIYAIYLQPMIEFYVKVFGFVVRESEDSHAIIVSNGFELVLVQAPEAISNSVEILKPPEARELIPIKPVFFIDKEISEFREKVKLNGGYFNSEKQEWKFNDNTACDGWDVEGNVFQIRY